MSGLFYDSARWGLLPAKSRAMLYLDGRYNATAQDAKRFSAVRWITVVGGVKAAAGAGAIDFELGNEAFLGDQLRLFAAERKAMNCRARVYTNLANLAAAHARVDDLGNVVYWIATLDGRQRTVAEVAALAAERGVRLAESQVWALQYAGGPMASYDTSELYGTW